MWLDSKAVNCPQKWGNFKDCLASELAWTISCHSEPSSVHLVRANPACIFLSEASINDRSDSERFSPM